MVEVIVNGAENLLPDLKPVSMMKLGPDPSPPYHVFFLMPRKKTAALSSGMFVFVIVTMSTPGYSTQSPLLISLSVLRLGKGTECDEQTANKNEAKSNKYSQFNDCGVVVLFSCTILRSAENIWRARAVHFSRILSVSVLNSCGRWECHSRGALRENLMLSARKSRTP